MSTLLPHYADRLAWIADYLEKAPARAAEVGAEYGAEHEAITLRVWLDYAVKDLRTAINDIKESNQ